VTSPVTSPVYAHFSKTLGGEVSVRAFRATKMFSDTNLKATNRMTRMIMAIKLCERWLGVRLEILGSLVCLISPLFCFLGVSDGSLSAGIVGLSLSYSMATTLLLTNTIRMFASMEAGMNSVEIMYMGSETPQEKWKD